MSACRTELAGTLSTVVDIHDLIASNMVVEREITTIRGRLW